MTPQCRINHLLLWRRTFGCGINDGIKFWLGLLINMNAISALVRNAVAGGLLAALAGVTPANATPTTWNLTGSSGTTCKQITGSGSNCIGSGSSSATNGNVFQFQTGGTSGPKLQAQAYRLNTVPKTTCTTKRGQTTCTTTQVNPNPWDTNSVTSPKLQKNFLGYYSAGLGVENTSAPQHSVDNNAGYDFVVFKLPTGVAYNQVTITLYNDIAWGGPKNMNATVLYGTPDPSLSISSTQSFYQKSVNQLLEGGFSTMTTTGLFLGSNQSSGAKTITIDSVNPITYLIVAASLDDPTMANFKIKSIAATFVVRVAEPASVAAFGAGLLGLGVFASRRRKTAKLAA
jgi:hypothetical protein